MRKTLTMVVLTVMSAGAWAADFSGLQAFKPSEIKAAVAESAVPAPVPYESAMNPYKTEIKNGFSDSGEKRPVQYVQSFTGQTLQCGSLDKMTFTLTLTEDSAVLKKDNLVCRLERDFAYQPTNISFKNRYLTPKTAEGQQACTRLMKTVLFIYGDVTTSKVTAIGIRTRMPFDLNGDTVFMDYAPYPGGHSVAGFGCSL